MNDLDILTLTGCTTCGTTDPFSSIFVDSAVTTPLATGTFADVVTIAFDAGAIVFLV